jgi:hypothetical protein
MATLATGLPATALTGLDLHQLDSNKRFRHLIMVPPLPRFPSATSHFVTSMTAPIASGWSNIAGWDLHPLRNAAFARRTPEHDIHFNTKTAPKGHL